jgi:hypothetical protein
MASSSRYKRRRLTLTGRKDFLYRRLFRGDVAVYFVAVGMVIGESRVNLRQSKMFDLCRDLFGGQTQVVPTCNAPQVTPVPAMQGRPLRISGDLSIRLPISTPIAIMRSAFSIDQSCNPHPSDFASCLVIVVVKPQADADRFMLLAAPAGAGSGPPMRERTSRNVPMIER